jgi:hypothetical protein
MLVAVCGSGHGGDGGETVTAAGPDGPSARWSSVTIGSAESLIDAAVTVIAVEGDPVVVAGDTSFAAWVVGDKAEPARMPDTPWEFFGLGGVARGPGPDGGLVVAGTGFAAGDEYGMPAALVSQDGRRWERADDGLAGTGAVRDVAATTHGFVAVGGLADRHDPEFGPFTPAAWWSTDGREWQRLDLGVPEAALADGSAAGLVSVAADGERLVATDRDRVWLSPDEGETWETVELPEATGISVREAVHGPDGFLIVGVTDNYDENVRPRTWTSRDGTTWAPFTPPEGLLDGVDFPVAAATSQGFVVGGVTSINAFADPARCYADVVACNQARGQVAALEDGSWSLLDTSGAGDTTTWRPEALAVSGDDLVAVTRGEQLTLWRHNLAELPRLEPPELPEPTGPPPIETGAALEVGGTYRYPLFIHCGAGYLGEFNGQHWFATAGEGVADDDLRQFPIVQDNYLFGEVTVVAADRIEYRVDNTLVRAYEPQPTEPPTCE